MNPPVNPIRIAVVGHTNAGKTSLLRTLTRRVNFGEVSEQPGTTRHSRAADLMVDGAPAVRFFDTPGLEDAAARASRSLRQKPDAARPHPPVHARP
jgi:small GTP-binding protein